MTASPRGAGLALGAGLPLQVAGEIIVQITSQPMERLTTP
jgi:hypothetical protein